MKIENMLVKTLSVLVSILILASCSKNDEALNSTDVENVSTELLSEVCVAEVSEMSVVIFSNIDDSLLGSTPTLIPDFSSIDSLLTGASIAISGTGGMNNPQGTITIDFKTGTTDRHGVVRKGIVNIKYSGPRWAVGSSHSISFSGYSRNNVMLDDSTHYIITNTDSTETTVVGHHLLTGCKLTFPDQKIFLRKAEFNASMNFVSKTTTILPVLIGDTTASGKTRYGVDFVMNVTKALVYKPQCIGAKIYLPNEGTKSITVGSTTYTVVYGSTRTCGKTVKVTLAGGKSTSIAVNSEGN